MASKKQIESNRKNALQSTGPKTPEGKAIVGKNAITYGLYSKEVVLTGGLVDEDPKEFEEMLQGLIADLQPSGSMETILVEKIAATSWRLKRLFRAECGSIKSSIIAANSENAYNSPTPVCPISIHDFVNRQDLSLPDLTTEMMELVEQRDLTGDDLHKDKYFQDLFEEKYPGKKPKDLSVHQMKRLRATFRSEINDLIREKAQMINYMQKARPQHLDCLIPSQRLISYGTTLERSMLKDLAALKQLQALRKAN